MPRLAMLRLALSSLRFRTGGFVASFVALVLGCAVVTACGGLMETGIRAVAPRAGKTLIPVSAVFGGIAVLVATFVVATTLGLTVTLRQREMALLRAIGATSGQLRRMVVGEGLLISVVATALGCVAGSPLGSALLDQFVAGGTIPRGTEYSQGFVPVVIGAGVGLLTAVAAAFVASRRAALARPVEALAEAALPQRWRSAPRTFFAVTLLAMATALGVVTATVMPGPVAATTAGPGAMLWVTGIALLAPGITGVLTRGMRRLVAASGGPARHLGMANVTASNVRTAGAVTPILLTTGLATALIYLQLGPGGDATGAAVNVLLVAVVVIYTVISLLNTLVISIMQRRREFALQRLVGCTGGQVIGTVVVEALATAVVGVVIGSVVALASLIPFSIAVGGSWWPAGPPGPYLVVIGASTLLTLGTAVVTARVALRADPASLATA